MFVLLGVDTDPDFKLKGLKYKCQKKKKKIQIDTAVALDIYIYIFRVVIKKTSRKPVLCTGTYFFVW